MHVLRPVNGNPWYIAVSLQPCLPPTCLLFGVSPRIDLREAIVKLRPCQLPEPQLVYPRTHRGICVWASEIRWARGGLKSQ